MSSFVIFYNKKGDKRQHLAEIKSLKGQVKGEEDFAAELDATHGKVRHSTFESGRYLNYFSEIIFQTNIFKMNEEMEPTKKQNKHLMGIIGAAEKGLEFTIFKNILNFKI